MVKKATLFFVILVSFFGYAQNDVRFDKATEAYNRGEFSEAIIYYEKAINTREKLPVGTYYYTLDPGDGQTPPKSGWLYITR